MKIVFIIGLPGSGKTHLGQELLAATPESVLLDDFSRHFSGNNEALRQIAVRSIDTLIITDPTACGVDRGKIEEKLDLWFGHFSLSFIAFENDPEACIANISGRDDRDISAAYVRTLSAHYDPSRYSKDVRPVYRKN